MKLKYLKNPLQPNIRSLVFMLFLLFLVNLAIDIYMNKVYENPHRFRVENQDLDTLENLIDEIKEDPGPKVVFVGDSSTYGSSVKSSLETIPYYTGEKLLAHYPDGNLRIYNLAMKGYGLPEVFFVINSLKNARIDLLIYNVSIEWFGNEQLVDHKNIFQLYRDDYKLSRLKEIGIEIPDEDNALENYLQSKVKKNFEVYRNRHLINFRLLGEKTLNQRMNDLKLRIVDPSALKRQVTEDKELYVSWQQKDWEKKFASDPDWTFGDVSLSQDNPQVEIYEEILSLIDKNSIPSLFYISPQNFELLTKHNRLNSEGVAQAVEDMMIITGESKHASLLNFIDTVDNTHFTDSIHMLAEGHQQLAEELFQNILRLELLGE